MTPPWGAILLLLLSSSSSAFGFAPSLHPALSRSVGFQNVGLRNSGLSGKAQPRVGVLALKAQLPSAASFVDRAQLFLADAAATASTAPAAAVPAAAAPAAAVPAAAAPAAAVPAAAAPAAVPAAAAPAATAAASAAPEAAKQVVVEQGGNILEQILGGDSLALTVMATVVLVLGIAVTTGVGYLTFANWKDEQYMKALQDPNSSESRTLLAQSRALEARESGSKAKKSKAMAELESLDSPNKPPQIIPDEPGNRDARRMRKKRRRQEEKQAARRETSAESAGVSSFSEEKNKGFFDNLFG